MPLNTCGIPSAVCHLQPVVLGPLCALLFTLTPVADDMQAPEQAHNNVSQRGTEDAENCAPEKKGLPDGTELGEEPSE